MYLFYTPDITGDTLILPDEELKHALHVLRLKTGDSVTLTDGKGFFYDADLETVSKKNLTVRITNKRKEETGHNYKLHIGIAPIKNISRFEWFLEKVTEIGIDEITPIITQHSERKVLRPERLEKIIISAMKQSLKAVKPNLNPVISLDEFLKFVPSDYQLFIAYYGAEGNKLLKNSYIFGKNILILIGPEGGFSPSEVEKAAMKGFKIISLGNSRLRTETAGIAACHTIFLLNQN